MRAKSQRSNKPSKAEDALEAKIRKKNAAAASTSRRSRRDSEEEKVEEGLSVSDESSEVSEDEMERGYKSSKSRSRGGGGGGGVASGVPVANNDGNDEEQLFTRGGGDVRNRPPQARQQQQLDPLRQAEIEKQKNKKEVNKRFADLHETGQWGGLSKWEKYGICLFSLGAIIAAIVLGVQFGRGPNLPPTPPPTSSPSKSPSAAPSAAPTLEPTTVDHREPAGLEAMRGASPKLTLPQTAEELIGAKERSASTPQELAAEYVLYDDPMELAVRDPRFLERYALVVFYFQNGGCSGDWIKDTNWMEGGDHCDGWFGIVCTAKGRVQEIGLSANYVTGKIPLEFGVMDELSTLDLSNNALEGEVPAKALQMSQLYSIQLNNNMLVGDFPFEDVKKEGSILDVLWIQENIGLEGTITDAYCPMNSITLDCENFNPQPIYYEDSYYDNLPVQPDGTPDVRHGRTKFEIECLENTGSFPAEYTCNFDPPEPFTKPAPNGTSAQVPAPTVCGTPAAGG